MLLPELASAPSDVVIQQVGATEVSEIQGLYERCTDYVLMLSGAPPGPNEAAEGLDSIPPGKDRSDKLVLGVYGKASQQLIGLIDLVAGFPNEGDWSLGLLMLDPRVRNEGLGTRLYRWLSAELRRLGARTIWIGVLEENPLAKRFWTREGFEEVREQVFTAGSGKEQAMWVLKHVLHPAA